MALVLMDSACVNLAVYLFVGAPPESGPSFAARGLNNVWMLLYIGLPLLYALERSPLTPNPPRWIHVPYRNIKKANLTQRFVIWFVIASALLMLFVSVLVIAFASGDEESFQTVVHTMFHEAAILIVPIFLPMFAFLHILERRFTRPIEVLALDQQTFIERMESDVEQGRRDTCIAVDERGTKPRHEIAELYESTNKMRRDMVGFIERLYSVTAERQRTATELDVARQIQMSAVPHDFDSLTERFALDIAGFMRPAREVGGDFYDVFEVGERGVAFVIGDVSGKGVPAALFMMRAQSLLRQFLLETDDLGTAFTLANRQLCERNDAMLFVTAFACVVDTATGEVRFANAGHNPPGAQAKRQVRQSCVPPGAGARRHGRGEVSRGKFRVQPRRRPAALHRRRVGSGKRGRRTVRRGALAGNAGANRCVGWGRCPRGLGRASAGRCGGCERGGRIFRPNRRKLSGGKRGRLRWRSPAG